MRLEEARRFALSLPETTEQPHFEKSSFRVRGKIFATVPPGGEQLNVFVDEHETRASVAEDPSAFEMSFAPEPRSHIGWPEAALYVAVAAAVIIALLVRRR